MMQLRLMRIVSLFHIARCSYEATARLLKLAISGWPSKGVRGSCKGGPEGKPRKGCAMCPEAKVPKLNLKMPPGADECLAECSRHQDGLGSIEAISDNQIQY